MLKPLIDAVGRIDVRIGEVNQHVGTGTVIAVGLVMTNRHVIDVFAEPLPGRDAGGRFLLGAPVSICFDEEASDEARRFAVKGIVVAGPWRVGRFADVAKLDVALLEVETTNASGAALPGATPAGPLFARSTDESKLIVVGYPAAPDREAAIDPDTGKVDPRYWDRAWELFGDRYGTKYLSPGKMKNRLGEITGDAHRWALSHDATTLGGNSGTPVISLRSPHRIGGLHFGGATYRQNLAHDLLAVQRAIAAEPSLIDLRAFGDFFG